MRRLLLVGALLLGGCSFLDESPPGRSCKINADCFTAQGETCDKTAKICKAGNVPDGSVTTIDASALDARTPDAQVADGGTD